MVDVILSIKPVHVEKILSGEKKYEFRKQIFKNPEVENVFIYSSSPVQRIVAVFRPDKILRDDPRNLWTELWNKSGLTEEEFFNYFLAKDEGYAISINDLIEFDEALDPKCVIDGFRAPQNFLYCFDVDWGMAKE